MSKNFFTAICLLSILSLEASSVLYVLNKDSHDISVVQTQTAQEVVRIATGEQPIKAVLDDRGQYLCVICAQTEDVSLIRTSQNAVERILSLLETPTDIVSVKDEVLVSHGQYLSIIDMDKLDITQTLDFGEEIMGVRVHWQSQSVCVFTLSSVTVIDKSTNTIRRQLQLNEDLSDVAFSFDGKTIYLAHGLAGRIQALDEFHPLPQRVFDCNASIQALQSDPRGPYLYVTTDPDGVVQVLDIDNGVCSGVFAIDGRMEGDIRFDQINNYAYAIHPWTHSLMVWDAQACCHRTEQVLIPDAKYVYLSTDQRNLYALSAKQNVVGVLSLPEADLQELVFVGNNPSYLLELQNIDVRADWKSRRSWWSKTLFVRIHWEDLNIDCYEEVQIFRNGVHIATVDKSVTQYEDMEAGELQNTYYEVRVIGESGFCAGGTAMARVGPLEALL